VFSMKILNAIGFLLFFISSQTLAADSDKGENKFHGLYYSEDFISRTLAEDSDKGENKFDGLYYNENKTNWSCNQLAEEDGPGASLIVEGLVLFNSGGSCQLTNPTSIRGMDATLFDGDCWGEGENYKYSIILMKDHRDDGIFKISDGYSTKLKNCNQ